MNLNWSGCVVYTGESQSGDGKLSEYLFHVSSTASWNVVRRLMRSLYLLKGENISKFANVQKSDAKMEIKTRINYSDRYGERLEILGKIIFV